MQNIDELLLQQRKLIIQMDQHYQKQVSTINERIAKQQGAMSPTTIPFNTTPVNKNTTEFIDQNQMSSSLVKPLPNLKK